MIQFSLAGYSMLLGGIHCLAMRVGVGRGGIDVYKELMHHYHPHVFICPLSFHLSNDKTLEKNTEQKNMTHVSNEMHPKSLPGL